MCSLAKSVAEGDPKGSSSRCSRRQCFNNSRLTKGHSLKSSAKIDINESKHLAKLEGFVAIEVKRAQHGDERALRKPMRAYDEVVKVWTRCHDPFAIGRVYDSDTYSQTRRTPPAASAHRSRCSFSRESRSERTRLGKAHHLRIWPSLSCHSSDLTLVSGTARSSLGCLDFGKLELWAL